MGTRRDNPHCPGTPEHLLWERYQTEYDAQPISSQLFDLEMHLRELSGVLHHMSGHVEPPRVQAQLRLKLRELEVAVKELGDAAERAARSQRTERRLQG